MMANKRSVDCMDSLIYSKMPRLENDQNGLSTGLYKPSPLSSYAAENPLKYTGSYLAYHLQNRDGTDSQGIWNQARPCVHHMGGPNTQSPPGQVSSLNNRSYQTEHETVSRPFQPSVNANDKLDLVKDLMNVRSKWVTFVERQKNLRKGQNLPAVLCSSAAGKHSLHSSALSTVGNSANVAFPQPVYRNSVCCSGAGFSLENSTDHFYRRGQETEWRMPPPVTSSCLIVNNSQLMHSQQYANPLAKNNSLHSGSGNIQISSVGRITKETGKSPGVRSPLCRGYGTYTSSVLQDPRYPVLSYENSNGTVPGHSGTSIHNIQDLQKAPLHPFGTTQGQQMQPSLYRDKPSPPKYPVPIQPKVLHSLNTISNQQSVGSYSLLHPHSYKAQMGNYPVPGASGRMPVPSSPYASQLVSENPYAQPSESFGYAARHPPPPPEQQKSISATGPLIHPVSQPATHSTEFEQQSPPGNKVASSLQDPTNAKHLSPDLLRFRPRIVAQTNERCYNSLNTLYNSEYTGPQQLISKHSAFHPVLSGKHLKVPFERPAGSPGDQRPKDIYLQEHSPGIHISPKGDQGRFIFSKEPEILNNKPVEVRLASPQKSYTVSPTRKTSVINFSPASSPASNESKRSTPPPSPPMPVINNVFSLAPYKAYLEATGLFFSKCPNCELDCDKSCSCSLKNKTQSSRSDSAIDLDSSTPGPKRLATDSSQLQPKNGELKTGDASVRLESTNEKGASEDELRKTVSTKNCLDVQHQEMNLSPKFNRLDKGLPQQSSNSARCMVHSGDRKLGMNKMEDEMALDLSTKSKSPPLNVIQHALVSGESGEKLKSTNEISNEKENTIESQSTEEKRESTWSSEEHGTKAVVAPSNESSNVSDHLIIEMNKYKILRPVPPKIGENNSTLPSEDITKAKKISLIGSVDPSALILRPLKPLKRILPDVVKSIMNSNPEPCKLSCETKVDSSCNGKLMQNENDTYNYFVHLHQSLCDMITQSVAETSEEVLCACLRDIEEKETPKLRSSVKSKNGTRSFEALKMSKAKEIWRNYGHVQQTLQKLLSYLESYIYSRTCPFPHVIRAGTIFIPIYLVKEKLFSSLKGATIDQVFQEHKIELRPTTLSEEKKLQTELQLQRCSSRLIKLLSLKQLPEIYQDLLDVLWHSCVKIRLGEQSDENMKEATLNPADKNANENHCAEPSSVDIRNETVANTACSIGKPDNGIATAKHNANSKKRRRKIRATTSSINCNSKCTDSSNSSQSIQTIKPKSVHHLEKKSCTQIDQDAGTARSSKVSQSEPRNLQKRRGVYNEKALMKGNFERKGTTLVVRLNRVTVNEDNKGTNVSCSRKIKKSQMPINKKNNGALRPTRSTSKVLHLRGSIVRLKFQKPRQTALHRNLVLKSIVAARKPILTRTSQRLDQKITKPLSCRKRQGKKYPNLVGKRIRHLYEEKDKSESWYKGVVVRVHEKHQNPLQTVYEVKYDTEPDWQYYLELLQDYEKGWLRVDD